MKHLSSRSGSIDPGLHDYEGRPFRHRAAPRPGLGIELRVVLFEFFWTNVLTHIVCFRVLVAMFIAAIDIAKRGSKVPDEEAFRTSNLGGHAANPAVDSLAGDL
jgi:hypothetical protein